MDKKKLKQPSISSIFSKKSIQPEPTVDSDSEDEVDGHGHGPDCSLDENVGEGEGSSARVDRDMYTNSDTGAGGDSDYTGCGGSGDELGEESQEISGGGSVYSSSTCTNLTIVEVDAGILFSHNMIMHQAH